MPSRLKAKQNGEAARKEAAQGIKEAEEERQNQEALAEAERLRQEALERGEDPDAGPPPPPEPEHQWLLVVGGLDGNFVHSSTELLHYQGDAFECGPDLLSPRWGAATIVLELGRVLVAGGFDGERYLETTEILDLKAWTVEPGPRMSLARCGCTAVRINARSLLVVGGYGQDTSEILDLGKMKFRPGPKLRRTRACAAAVMLDEHRFMIAGGYDRLGCCKETEIMDLRRAPTEDEWDPTTPPNVEKGKFLPWLDLKAPRGGCSVAFLPTKGRVLFVGGFDGKRRLPSTELLDLANYNIPCDRRPAKAGEQVLSLNADGHVERLWKPPKKKTPEGEEEDEESETEIEEEEEGEAPKPKVKTWVLLPGELATVLEVYEEGLEEREGNDDAMEGTFRLRNPGGYDTNWLSMQEFAYVPTNEMFWEPSGPNLEFARSGAAVGVLPLSQLGDGEERPIVQPRFFVIGGCSDVPNQSLNATEILGINDKGAEVFVEGPSTYYRRAYCSVATVTVLGDIGKPKPPPEEEASQEQGGELFPVEDTAQGEEGGVPPPPGGRRPSGLAAGVPGQAQAGVSPLRRLNRPAPGDAESVGRAPSEGLKGQATFEELIAQQKAKS